MRISFTGPVLFFALSVAAGSAWADGPSTSPAAEAERVELFEKASADYQNGRWKDAADKLERVVAIRRTSEALRGLALAEKELRRLVSAKGHAKEALHLAEGRPDEQAVCEKVLATIAPLVPRVDVTLPSDVQDARILVDGVLQNGVLELDPGKHTVRVEAPGYEPFEERIEVSAGARTSVTAALRAIPSKGAEPPRSRTPWVAGGATLIVVGVGGAAAGVSALVLTADQRRSVLDPRCVNRYCPPAYQPFVHIYNTYFPLGVGGTIASVLALAGGVTLLALAPAAPKNGPEAPAVSLYVGPAALGLTGRF